jgi:glutamyl-tRNA reductase
MPLVCLGLSHHTAPAEVRERHSFPPARVGEALIALRDYEAVREAAIISTCNRLEIYAELEDTELGLLQLKEFLVNFRHGGMAYDMEPYLYVMHGNDAIEHLFRVSTGLDSMLIGDAEVLGQVKDAYRQARRARSLGKTLHRVFNEALGAGKAARSKTVIGNESVSIATAAIAMAKVHVGDLHGKSVLVIGAGKMGKTAAKRLKIEGAEEILIANRTHERARELVSDLGIGQAVELGSLVDALKVADVVITSTGASHFVLTPGNVAEAMLARPERPLFVIDVAVPRDVDPEVARIPGVALVDIDRMGETVDVTLEHRRAAIPLVETIIADHLSIFDVWYRSRAAIPVISSLSQKAESIRSAEVERVLGRCPGLSERERILIAGMSLTIVSRLLHSVITKIRDDASAEAAEVQARTRLIDELFELRLDEAKLQAEPWMAAFAQQPAPPDADLN